MRLIQSFALTLITLCVAPMGRAQFSSDNYDDYGSFANDPTELDNEVTEVFGRFFQTSLQVGTGIHTGGLGQAYSAGMLAQIKFVFYFDKMWASELSAGYGQSKGLYTEDNTETANVDLSLTMNVVPLQLGLRYGFNQDRLTRGFATMNPYIAANAEILFRNEVVVGTPTITGLTSAQQADYGQGGVKSNSAFGFNLGGGFEFDVYKRRLYLGLDVRYHVLFWSNAEEFFGTLSRGGNFVSILGAATYNY
jgi:hypothetical protein